MTELILYLHYVLYYLKHFKMLLNGVSGFREVSFEIKNFTIRWWKNWIFVMFSNDLRSIGLVPSSYNSKNRNSVLTDIQMRNMLFRRIQKSSKWKKMEFVAYKYKIGIYSWCELLFSYRKCMVILISFVKLLKKLLPINKIFNVFFAV